MEENQEVKVEKTKGGAKTLPFIFSNEVCEKLAMAGIGINFMSYLTEELNLPITKSVNILTYFSGTTMLMTFIGAFVADSYAGRFWSITGASVLYLMAMTSLCLSATLPGLRPPSCKGHEVCQEATEAQLSLLYICLVLFGIAGGGLRPCIVPFGADQFDESNPKAKVKQYNYFNWYYIVMGLSILVSMTVIVYIQDNVGWGWGLGIPTTIWLFSIVFFVSGYNRYRILAPSGSPFTRLFQVTVAFFKKRNSPRVSDPSTLYENDKLDDSIIVNGKLLHTKQMVFLDKAAVMTEDDKLSSGAPNLWSVSTVHRVEELKSILRMGPIWASGLILTAASANQGNFGIPIARSMDRHITKSFQIPPASMGVFTVVSMLITVIFYDRIFIPLARRFTGVDRGISYLHRMTIGFTISILATSLSGYVEIKRKQVAAAHGLIDSPKSVIPISVFWLVPQHALYGIAEGFMSVGHLEFFFDQSPDSMRATATAFYCTAIGAGMYLSSVIVTLVHKFTKGPNGSSWLPDHNINVGHLEYFYWLIAVLEVVNLVYYVICVKYYVFKAVDVQYKGKELKDEKALTVQV